MENYLQKVQEGIQAQTFAKLMGFEAEEAGEGYAVICSRHCPVHALEGVNCNAESMLRTKTFPPACTAYCAMIK